MDKQFSCEKNFVDKPDNFAHIIMVNYKKSIECGISFVIILIGLFAPVMSAGDGVSFWDTLTSIFKGETERFYYPWPWIAGLVGIFVVITGICYLVGVVKNNRRMCGKSSICLCIAAAIILVLFSRPTTFVVQINFGDYFGSNGLLSFGFWVPFVGGVVGIIYYAFYRRRVNQV